MKKLPGQSYLKGHLTQLVKKCVDFFYVNIFTAAKGKIGNTRDTINWTSGNPESTFGFLALSSVKGKLCHQIVPNGWGICCIEVGAAFRLLDTTIVGGLLELIAVHVRDHSTDSPSQNRGPHNQVPLT